MLVLSSIFGFLLMLGLLIFIHEFGHFLAAKLFGVKVEVFSLGFGPRMFGFQWGETLYQICWVPLGGYVRMLGELDDRDVTAELQERSFAKKALWKRAIIVLAGPMANLIILPIGAFFLLYIFHTQEISTVIGTVIPGRPAAKAGLRAGDRIDQVDGMKARYFRDLLHSIGSSGGKKISLKITRGKKQLSIQLTPETFERDDRFGSSVKRSIIGITAGYRSAEVGISAPNSPAFRAGLRTWDRILSVNGKQIERWEELVRYRKQNPKGPHTYTFKRPIIYQGAALELRGWMPKEKVTVHPVVQGKEGKKISYDGLDSSELFVESTRKGTPLAKVGLRAGDRLVSMAGRKLQVQSDLSMLPRKEGHKYKISFIRAGKLIKKKFTLFANNWVDPLNQKHKQVVLGVLMSRPYKQGVYAPIQSRVRYAFSRATGETFMLTKLMIRAIGKLFTGKAPTKSLGGPIMIFQIAQHAMKNGWDTFLRHLALISINLGLLNLLPIPILDGGHLVFFLIEGLIRRPIPQRYKEAALMAGLALLLMLMMLAFKNDIQRVFFPATSFFFR